PCVSSAQVDGMGPTTLSVALAEPPAGTVVVDTVRSITCPGSTCDRPLQVRRKSIGTWRTAPGATSPRYRLAWAPAVRTSASPPTVLAIAIVPAGLVAAAAGTTW